MMRIEAPAAEVSEAVREVTQDQIVHGTYSFEKERILYGAHSASEARVFGVWKGPGIAYYKVAEKILSPRYFKDTADIGTISVRYVVQDADASAAIVRIDAVFVDARNVHHASEGNVESGEYAAIQEHLRKIQARRQKAEPGAATAGGAQPAPQAQPDTGPRAVAASTPPQPMTVPEMQKRVDALRQQVELRVREQGAQLKSAPFHSAATLESLPAQTDVLVVVLSAYWYGVETGDGHHGWIHHSQLEPLP